MPSIEYVNLALVRTSTSAGHSCSVEYSYYLHTGKDEFLADEVYTVGCMLMGGEVLHHRKLGNPPYDLHTVSSHESMPVKRHFMVPCEILNEAWGKDHISLRLMVTTPEGGKLSADSDVVSDWF